MSVNVTIPTPLREHTEGKDSVEVQGSTVKEVFQDLGRQYTSITDRLLDGEKVRRFVNIFVNDEDDQNEETLLVKVKYG